MMNRDKWGNGSIHKGVTKHKGKFVARAQANGDRRYLGIFKSEAEAAAAYNDDVVARQGEFARLNNV